MANTPIRFSRPSTVSGLNGHDLLPTVVPPNESWKQIMDALIDLLRLEDDWDGQGAKAPSQSLVHSSIELARMLSDPLEQPMDALPFGTVPSRVVPGVNGTVIFEWQEGETYSELEVTQPGCGDLVVMQGQNPATLRAIEW